MSSSFDFLIPKPQEKDDFYSYGTVTNTGPLRVLIDGDVDDVEAVPTTLASLSIGDRVYVTIKDRQLIVLGIVGGIGITTEQISQIVPKKPLAPTSFALYDSNPGDGIPEYPEAYEDSSLGYLARVRFVWSPVFVDVDGDPITLKSYEIWGRRVGDTTTRLLYTAGPNDLSALLDGFKVTDTWEFFVRAIGSVGSVPSDFFPSAGLEVDFPELLLPIPPIPSTPQLVPGRGNIEVTWDGTFTNAAEATHDFRGIYIYASETSFTTKTDPGVQLIGFMAGVEADKITIGRPVTTWFIRLEGYSNAGKRSGLSAEASTTVLSVADPAIMAELDSRLDQAEIDLASTFTEIGTVDGKVIVLEASALVDVDYEYAVSTSNTVAPTTGWSTDTPVWQEGEYIWFRTVTITGDNTTTTSAPALLTGNTGDQGEPGADAYTVLLSNESHTFPGSISAALAGSTTSTVTAYKGTAAIAATVGVITGQVTGLTTAITNNNTTAPLITITVTTALVTKSGVLTVPITVDGKVFTKLISWSVSYTGATGAKGSTGTAGTSATNVVIGSESQLISTTVEGAVEGAQTIVIPFAGYIGTARAAASVVASDLPTGIWVATNVAATTSADGTLTLNVDNGSTLGGTLSGSFTLTFTCNSMTFVKKFSWAKTVTDSPKIFHSTSTPGSTSAVDGSTWFQHDTTLAGNIIGQWTRQSGIWSSTPLNNQVIANLDAGKITSGYIASARIDADTISASQIVASEALWTKVLGAHLIQATEINADSIRTAILTAGVIKANMLDVEHVDANGQKMTLTPEGLRLWGPQNPDDPEGEALPSISLTTSDSQVLNILGGDNLPAVTLENTGQITGTAMSTDYLAVNDSFTYRGTPIEGILSGRIIARGNYTPSSANAAVAVGSSRVLMQLSFDALPGHSYRITARGPVVTVGTASLAHYGSCHIKIGRNGYIPIPTDSYPIGSLVFIGPGTSVTASTEYILVKEATESEETVTAVYAVAAGNAGLSFSSNYREINMTVVDLGETIENTGVPLNGTTTPQTTLKTFTYEWGQSWYNTYANQGEYDYDYNNAYAYQGYYLSTRGTFRSGWGFPSTIWTSAYLTGASSISKVEVYLKNLHTYSSTGMDAVLAVHGYNVSSAPATLTSVAGSQTVHFNKGEAKWVTLPSGWYPAFLSGDNRGIALACPTQSSVNTYYGYFDGAATRIRFTYTKEV